MIDTNNPLIKAILRNLPSGDILDTVADYNNINPGLIRNKISTETEKILHSKKGLNGKKLIVSTTSDLFYLEKLIKNKEPRTLMHYIAINKNLPHELALKLAHLAILKKDSNLAMSIFRYRSDIGIILNKYPGLLKLIGFKDGKPIYDYLPVNMSHMTLEELNSLSKNINMPINDFIYKYISLLSENKVQALKLDALLFLHEVLLGNNYYSYKLKNIKSKFLLNFLSHFKGDKYKILLKYTLVDNEKDYRYHYKHICFVNNQGGRTILSSFDNLVLVEFAELLGYDDKITNDWECIQILYDTFIKLSYNKQVIIYKKATPGLREELLYHNSKFFYKLSNDSSNNKLIDSKYIEIILDNKNYYILRSMVDNLKLGTNFRNKYISDNIELFLNFVELSGEDYGFLLYTVIENTNDINKVFDLLYNTPLDLLINELNHEVLANEESYENSQLVKSLISSLFASDPFISEECMIYVLDAFINIKLKEKISYIALDYIAKFFINSSNFSYETLVLISKLAPDWSGTYRELHIACEKL